MARAAKRYQPEPAADTSGRYSKETPKEHVAQTETNSPRSSSAKRPHTNNSIRRHESFGRNRLTTESPTFGSSRAVDNIDNKSRDNSNIIPEINILAQVNQENIEKNIKTIVEAIEEEFYEVYQRVKVLHDGKEFRFNSINLTVLSSYCRTELAFELSLCHGLK